MHSPIRGFFSKISNGALASISLGLIALGATGCTVHIEHHHDEPRREVYVEQPVGVVYEQAPTQVVAVYETNLSPYGEWVTVGNYGRCWRWRVRHEGWRPYTVGHWVATADGWLWVSEGEEADWGATCYHYGRWYEDASYGWVWVPGRIWAPSWCAWREGGGYSCWAPLPPECGDGHVFTAAMVDRYVPRERFVCVETRDIANVSIHNTIILNTVNVHETIINKTVNITNVTYVNNRAVNRGVDVKHVEAAVGHSIEITHATKVTTAEEAQREIKLGHAVVYSPAEVETYAKAHPVGKKTAAHKETPAREENKPLVREEEKPAVKEEHKTEENKTAVHEEKPAVKEEHKTVVNEEKPAVKEEHKTAVNEEKPVVKEEHKTAVQEEKPAVKDEHKTAVHEEKPAMKEEHKTAVHEEKPAAKDKTETKSKTDEKDPKKRPGDKPEESNK